jgi:F-box interacting protein
MGRSKKRGRNPADDLTDDLVVEILSRLPAKSVCRFKCVSKHWCHGLIAHPDHRSRLPQTLSGFFRSSETRIDDGTKSSPIIDSDDDDDLYESDHDTEWTIAPNFVSILGKKKEKHAVVSDPALSFLTGYRSVIPKSCSNGLLLCLCWKVASTTESDYVVCNPATQQWVTVPGNAHRFRTDMRMFLAAAASGHFHIFALLHDEDWEWYTEDVDIYSSEAGAWSHHESGWAWDTKVSHRGVFHHGMLHLVTISSTIVAVDTKGTTWRTIPLLESMATTYRYSSNGPFIGVSQERFHYVSHRRRDEHTLSVWILGDGGDDENQWTYRYSISTTRIFGAKITDLEDYSLVGIHPECNTVFFGVKRNRKYLLLSYDMDRGKVRTLGNIRFGGWSYRPYLPYVPSFSRIVG